ncbi:hypothetical protein BC937DRAFT_90165 [Endogone sp. FLAS-F59071]|nr:hypothetical protein BC937DRAFT_90165 [Endogone sp. FLAS-F59071]|eukprot:RUS17287.1 hypothetical protein BC937DRAFT_90165 [Endogone sp. FLAS-F59071]
MRGIQMLKVGGRIVYSTCSFNPIENEAVVAEALRLCKGALEILDVSNELPGLKRYPGLQTWKAFSNRFRCLISKVMSKDGEWIDSFKDIDNQQGKYTQSMFPPANANEIKLERCIRIYPHLQDTGGFFVAVFKKVSPMTAIDRAFLARQKGEALTEPVDEKEDEALLESIKAESTAEDHENEQTQDDIVPAKRSGIDETPAEPPKRARIDEEGKVGENSNVKQEHVGEFIVKDTKVSTLKEEPFIFLDHDNDDIKQFSDFYGLSSTFPVTNFLVRSEKSRSKTIYFVSDPVKAVLQAADAARLRVVNTGVKAFVRQDHAALKGACPFRVSSEILPMLAPFLSDRRSVNISLSELRTLVMVAFPKVEEFTGETYNKVNRMESGCCVFYFDPATSSELKPYLRVSMILPVWKAKVSLNLLINKQERRSLSLRLFGELPADVPPYIKGQVDTGETVNMEMVEGEEGEIAKDVKEII